jgi:hypothetical protein
MSVTRLTPLLFLLCAACGTDSRPGEVAVAGRDSAGVRIVENHAPAWAEGEAWTVSTEPSLTIGSAVDDEGYFLHQVMGALRLDDGRIVVANAGTNELRLYGPDGAYLETTGRAGEGPGEYEAIYSLSRYVADSILVADPALGRTSIVDESGSFGRSVRIDGRHETLGSLGDGSLVLLKWRTGASADYGAAGITWLSGRVMVMSPHGSAVDTIGEFDLSQNAVGPDGRPARYLFQPWHVRAITDSSLFWARGDSFAIREYNREGNLLRIIRKTHTPTPVTESLKKEFVGSYLRVLERDGFPEERRNQIADEFYAAESNQAVPPFRSMLLDRSGNLWVGNYSPDPYAPSRYWEVFGTEGSWLGTVETPPGVVLYEIGDDYLLGRSKDEYGVEYVVLYSLRKR